MTFLKMPPIEKVHEALSAVADERIVINNLHAEVYSSDKTKKYLVDFEDNVYSANDNASYWQGYAGYPIIAVLLIQGKLEYNKEILSCFIDINWKELNKKYKNNYEKSVNEVFENLKEKGINVSPINDQVDKIYEQLGRLDIKLKRSKTPPPK